MNKFIFGQMLLALPLSGGMSAPAMAVKSVSSSSISANPSISHFQAVGAGVTSPVQSTEIKNIGSSPLTLGTLALSGEQSSQFRITQDACSQQTIQAGAACMVELVFEPTALGYKQALLDIPSDAADTPVLQTFLTSYEDSRHAASRRLPPVLYSLNVPETMVSGQTYTLEWSLLGYHDDYTTALVMFNCTGVTDNTCGNNYTDSTRFFETAMISADTHVATAWHQGDVYAREFKFKTEFTPNFAQQTDMVIRFYQKTSDDVQAGLGSLSLLIPGNLAGNYYDKEGRRLRKTITPN